MRKTTPAEVRFWRKVNKAGPIPECRPDLGSCWLWTGYLDANGYGWINVGGRAGKEILAARFGYELLFGPIPEGLEPDHLCRLPACVNPFHLEPVTHRVNMLRGNTIAARNAAVTHCPHGHEYNELNTYRQKDGSRYCRPCHYARERRRKNRLRQVA